MCCKDLSAMASQPKKSKQESNLIKSRQRVRDLAEVFTNRREVDAMLDLVGETAYDSRTGGFS
jgi:hypothetical protein